MNDEDFFLSLINVFDIFDEGTVEEIYLCNDLLIKNWPLFEHLVVFCGAQDEYEKLVANYEDRNTIQNLKILFIGPVKNIKDAFYCGLRNSIGDYVLLLDNKSDTHDVLNEISNLDLSETAIYYFKNLTANKKTVLPRALSMLNRLLERGIFGVDRTGLNTNTMLISRRISTQIFQQKMSRLFFKSIRYQTNNDASLVTYEGLAERARQEPLFRRYTRVLSEIFGASNAPLKIVSSLMLLATFLNVILFVFAFIVKIVSSDVEPGWASSTMQSSVMFFLISICLYLLIEYLTNLLESLTSEVDVPIRSEFNQQKHVDQLNVKEIRYEV